jgi:hypothetical protein
LRRAGALNGWPTVSPDSLRASASGTSGLPPFTDRDLMLTAPIVAYAPGMTVYPTEAVRLVVSAE